MLAGKRLWRRGSVGGQEAPQDGREGHGEGLQALHLHEADTIRGTRRTGRKRARLRVSASFGGNASLGRSRKSTSVRIL